MSVASSSSSRRWRKQQVPHQLPTAHPHNTMACTHFNCIWVMILLAIRMSSVVMILQPHLSSLTTGSPAFPSSQSCNTTNFMEMSDASTRNNPLYSPFHYDTSFGRPPQMLYHESHRSPELHHTCSGANTIGKNAVQYNYGHSSFDPTPSHRYALKCKLLQSGMTNWSHKDKCSATSVRRYQHRMCCTNTDIIF